MRDLEFVQRADSPSPRRSVSFCKYEQLNILTIKEQVLSTDLYDTDKMASTLGQVH